MTYRALRRATRWSHLWTPHYDLSRGRLDAALALGVELVDLHQLSRDIRAYQESVTQK